MEIKLHNLKICFNIIINKLIITSKKFKQRDNFLKVNYFFSCLYFKFKVKKKITYLLNDNKRLNIENSLYLQT